MDKMTDNIKKFREEYTGNREPKFLNPTKLKTLKYKNGSMEDGS